MTASVKVYTLITCKRTFTVLIQHMQHEHNK